MGGGPPYLGGDVGHRPDVGVSNEVGQRERPTFVRDLEHYMTYLRERGLIEAHRLLRRKLGLGPNSLGEFLLLLEVNDLAQLEQAFQHVASRKGEVEERHFAVNSKIQSVVFALYRDFPDPVRSFGEERF